MPKTSRVSIYHMLTFTKVSMWYISVLSGVKKILTHIILGIYKDHFSPKKLNASMCNLSSRTRYGLERNNNKNIYLTRMHEGSKGIIYMR